MDRRNRPPRQQRGKLFTRMRKAYENIIAKKAIQENREREIEKNEELINSLKLAADVERELKFGDDIRILSACPGCLNCNNERECYVVEVSKNAQLRIE